MGFAYTAYSGKDPTLWLLHPIATGQAIWHPLLPELNRSFRVITVDLPGHGQTPAWPAPVSLETVADKLAQQIAADGHPAVLVGHSLGGMVAQGIAIKQPPWLRGLVLTSTMPGPGGSRQAMRDRANSARSLGMAGLLDPTLTRWFVPETLHRPTEAVATVRKLVLAADPEAHANTWEAMAEFNALDELPKVAVPTLILVGNQDVSTPLAVAQTMARAIGYSQMQVIPNAGHALPQEAPQVWLEAVLEFVRGLS